MYRYKVYVSNNLQDLIIDRPYTFQGQIRDYMNLYAEELEDVVEGFDSVEFSWVVDRVVIEVETKLKGKELVEEKINKAIKDLNIWFKQHDGSYWGNDYFQLKKVINILWLGLR